MFCFIFATNQHNNKCTKSPLFFSPLLTHEAENSVMCMRNDQSFTKRGTQMFSSGEDVMPDPAA